MFHYFQGKPTRQAHKGIPAGYFEEEQGRKGFFGQVSHLIKSQPSTRWENIEGPLRPRLFDLVPLKHTHWQPLMSNGDVEISDLRASPKDPLSGFRSADGDTLYFCHSGSGVFLSEYGLLHYRAGHYILIPKCVTHTLVAKESSQFLLIESKRSAFREPDRGMVGRHAVYDTQAYGLPNLDEQKIFLSQCKEVLQIRVKRLGEITTFSYKSSIYDTVAWKGDLFPVTLHMDDIMPLMSHRAHLPPSAHTTFVADGFVVCSFVPRPLEEDEDALKVPFYHQNIDYDEVIFYHKGNFFSRDHLHPNMITLHPAGFPHGPHPKAITNVKTKNKTDEYAVMVDTWSPLQIAEPLQAVEVNDYWQSWK